MTEKLTFGCCLVCWSQNNGFQSKLKKYHFYTLLKPLKDESRIIYTFRTNNVYFVTKTFELLIQFSNKFNYHFRPLFWSLFITDIATIFLTLNMNSLRRTPTLSFPLEKSNQLFQNKKTFWILYFLKWKTVFLCKSFNNLNTKTSKKKKLIRNKFLW